MFTALVAAILLPILPTTPSLTLDEAAALVPTVWIAQCDYLCFSCPDPDEHIVNWVGDPWGLMDSAHNESCTSQGSCEGHACTAPTPEPVAAVQEDPTFWHAMSVAPVEDIKAFLANNVTIARFNPVRKSIQVRGCNNELIVNLPLSPAQLAEIDP
jgi:hypothetical protein